MNKLYVLVWLLSWNLFGSQLIERAEPISLVERLTVAIPLAVTSVGTGAVSLFINNDCNDPVIRQYTNGANTWCKKFMFMVKPCQLLYSFTGQRAVNYFSGWPLQEFDLMYLLYSAVRNRYQLGSMHLDLLNAQYQVPLMDELKDVFYLAQNLWSSECQGTFIDEFFKQVQFPHREYVPLSWLIGGLTFSMSRFLSAEGNAYMSLVQQVVGGLQAANLVVDATIGCTIKDKGFYVRLLNVIILGSYLVVRHYNFKQAAREIVENWEINESIKAMQKEFDLKLRQVNEDINVVKLEKALKESPKDLANLALDCQNKRDAIFKDHQKRIEPLLKIDANNDYFRDRFIFRHSCNLFILGTLLYGCVALLLKYSYVFKKA